MDARTLPRVFHLILLVLGIVRLLDAQGPATVALTTSPKPSVFGAPVTLTATVTPSSSTGGITFYDGVTMLGTANLNAGTAVMSTPLLAAGNRQLRAYYGGDTGHLPATSATVIQTVSTAASARFAIGPSSVVGKSPSPAAFAAVAVDFDRDGKPDLAAMVMNSSGKQFLSILMGNGSSFQPALNTDLVSGPNSIATADFNGDGKPDLVIATAFGVSVYFGKGDGTFQTPFGTGTIVAPNTVATGDFNGDGKADLVTTTPGGVAILLGNGDGTFLPELDYSGLPGLSAAMVADLNGDGKADLAFANAAADSVTVLIGNGDGTFQAAASYPGGYGPSALVAGDFNADGNADLAVTDSGSNTVSILLGNGAGVFLAPVGYAVGYAPSAVTVIDFNGDGKADLAVSNLPDNTVSVLLGNGDGTFRSAVNTAVGKASGNSWPASAFVIAADFNGDGKTDLAVSNPVDGAVGLLLGTNLNLTVFSGTQQSAPIGSAFPVTLQALLQDGDNPVVGAIVPLSTPATGPGAFLSDSAPSTNGSGLASVLAVANGIAGSYQVTASYRGLSTSFSLTNSLTSPANLRVIRGTPQVAAVGTLFTTSLQVTLQDMGGNPMSGQLVTFSVPASGASAVLSSLYAITNASGVASVTVTANNIVGTYFVTATANQGSLLVTFSLSNLPASTVTLSAPGGPWQFGSPVTLSATLIPTASTGRVTFYDGVTVLGTKPVFSGAAFISTITLAPGSHQFTASYSGDQTHAGALSSPLVRLVRAGSAGVFSLASPLTGIASGPQAVTVWDFNGDTFADMAIATAGGTLAANVTVTLGNGDGTFQAPVAYALGIGTAVRSITTGDVNSDGRPDLIVVNGNVSILLNNGDGTFRAATANAAGAGANFAAPGDFNRDGNLDLAVTNSLDGTVSILIGNGDGSFRPAINYPVGAAPTGVAIGDFNLDGLADLVVANHAGIHGTGDLNILYGNGDGTFQAAALIAEGVHATCLGVADFNGDGKLDLVVADDVRGIVRILLGSGDGSFRQTTHYAVESNPQSLAISDFNGDGYPDLAVTNFGSGSVSILAGNGDGTFQAAQNYPMGSQSTGVAVGDFNRDGKADLVVTNQGDDSAGILLAGSPTLTPTVSHVGNFTQGQNAAAYTILVGKGPVSGLVTVTAIAPAGMTIAGASGTGWTCTSGTCTRSDELDPLAYYPPITLLVNVAQNASSPLYMMVNLSGGGSAPSTGSDLTLIGPPFSDVAAGDPYFDAINLMRQYAITSGCTVSQYCPNDNVTRGQMAVFVVRSMMGGDNFSYQVKPFFTDVPSTHPFYKWVQKMRELGITAGCLATAYCPDAPVTRAQMSVFIVRARLGPDTVFPFPTTPYFTDVPSTQTYFTWIQKMKQLGITSGCGADTYCPDDSVTRAQMAVFLMRGVLNQLLPVGTPVVTSISPSGALSGQTVNVTITGLNTSFAGGVSQVTAGAGVTVSNVVVVNATTITATFVIADDAIVAPRSITVTTGTEEATLPNGFFN